MVEITEDIPLIVMSKDGAEYGYPERTHQNGPYYLKKNPSLEEVNSVIREIVTDEETHRSTVVETTVKAYRVYVESVSGATVETDTGDGTKENPFQCINSAFKVFRTTPWYCVDVCRCDSSTRYGEILVSGVIDYNVDETPVYPEKYENWRIIIRGVNDPVFSNTCDFTKTWIYITLCIFTDSDISSGNTMLAFDYQFVLDRCKIQTENDHVRGFRVLTAGYLIYNRKNNIIETKVICENMTHEYNFLYHLSSINTVLYGCNMDFTGILQFHADHIEESDLSVSNSSGCQISFNNAVESEISVSGQQGFINFMTFTENVVVETNDSIGYSGVVIQVSGEIYDSEINCETSVNSTNPTVHFFADIADVVDIKIISNRPLHRRDTRNAIDFRCPLFENSTINITESINREDVPEGSFYSFLCSACSFGTGSITEYLLKHSEINLNINFTGSLKPGSSIEYIEAPFQANVDLTMIYSDVTSSEASDPSIIYHDDFLNNRKHEVFSINGSGEYHHDV